MKFTLPLIALAHLISSTLGAILLPRASDSTGLVSRTSNSYCTATYEALKMETYYEIYGNFHVDVQDFGNKQLAGCNIKNWNYRLIPVDGRGMKWKMDGWAYAGQKNCLGNALIAVGGNDRGDCSGAG